MKPRNTRKQSNSNRCPEVDPSQEHGLARDQRCLYTRQQAAEFLGVAIRTIDNRLADGTFRKFKMGRLVRIEREDLEAYIVPVCIQTAA